MFPLRSFYSDVYQFNIKTLSGIIGEMECKDFVVRGQGLNNLSTEKTSQYIMSLFT